jgi:ABC-type Fe3+/spermidine/putrescine transport system ATPase subunit
MLRTTCGATVRAPSEAGLAAGEPVKLMVRPENMSLLGPGESADNAIEAVLDDVILVGGVTKHYARLRDGAVVSATSLTRGPPRPVERGAAVRLGWPRERTVALPERGAAGP